MASIPPSISNPQGGSCPHCGEVHPPPYTHCPKTGRSLRAGSALIGRVVAGRYKIVGVLGEGGMGAVYLAEHVLIGRKVALKRLHPELAGDAAAVQRFQREARAAAATGHEHIVEILDLGYAEDGAPYLVMEHLRGHSLASVIKNSSPLSPARACAILGQLLAALDAVHREGIVHRDLKPDNVFLTRRGGAVDYVKVLDFGISKMKQDEGALDLTKTGVMMGTPYYMSPEQARGIRAFDTAVDLYAAGVILYECITGRLPHHGENYHALLQAILRTEPPAPSALVPGIEPALEAVMLQALAKTAAARFPSARAMLEALVPFGAARIADVAPANDRADPMAHTRLEEARPRRRTETLPGDERTQRSPRSGAMSDAAPRFVLRPVTALRSAESVSKRSAPSTSVATTSEASRPVPNERARRFDEPQPSRSSTSPEASHGPSPSMPARSGEPMLKGAFFVAALEHITERFGAEQSARVLSTLDEATRGRLGGVILPMAWLPIAAFEALLRATERELGAGDGTTATTLGRAVAEREAQTTHRLFMQTATPSLAVERIPHFFRIYHAHGDCRPQLGGDTSVRLEVDSGAPESALYTSAFAGFFQRFLELAGAKDVKGNAVACRAQGDKESVIALRWR